MRYFTYQASMARPVSWQSPARLTCLDATEMSHLRDLEDRVLTDFDWAAFHLGRLSDSPHISTRSATSEPVALLCNLSIHGVRW